MSWQVVDCQSQAADCLRRNSWYRALARGRTVGRSIGYLLSPGSFKACLRQQLGRLKTSGLTIVLAEQNVRFVSELGDRVYILEKGMVRYEGSMAEFLADGQVRQAYLAV